MPPYLNFSFAEKIDYKSMISLIDTPPVKGQKIHIDIFKTQKPSKNPKHKRIPR